MPFYILVYVITHQAKLNEKRGLVRWFLSIYSFF